MINLERMSVKTEVIVSTFRCPFLVKAVTHTAKGRLTEFVLRFGPTVGKIHYRN